MVSRDPKDLFEAFSGGGEGQGEMVCLLAHIATEDQAIVEVEVELSPKVSVCWIAEVKVSNGVEAHLRREN